ncbi:pilus (MSHA type) biogenesis protein MshL [Nitratifractor sp.]
MKLFKRLFFGFLIAGSILVQYGNAEANCVDRLFNVTISDSLTIEDAIDNLAETCGLTVVVKDSGARHKLKKKLYYVKLKNATLKSFLDTILKDNDLNYSLRGNKLSISYLVTRTYKLHYVTGQRSGQSSANVQVAGGASSSKDNAPDTGKGSTITIKSDQEFQFWGTIKDEIHRILNTAGDGSIHFTKVGNAWIGPDGQKWEYNPLEPVINPEAGLVTVTGTSRQLERVDRYIATLMKQVKTEVMIDVKILDVRLDKSKSLGIDWAKIFDTSIAFGGKYQARMGNGRTDDYTGTPLTFKGASGGVATFALAGDLTGVLKFLKTQGDVTVVSSPRVMTLNNQPAMISVGQEIFYKLKTTNKVGGSDTATSENETVESVFAGILLDITPEVDARGMITLKINPSITSLADEEQKNHLTNLTMPPNIKRRQISAVIKVEDGNHAILGGLITKSKGTTTDKIPLLGDIPILGYAFKKDQVLDYTDELVIIITPHIVRSHRNVTLRDLGYKNLK